MRNVIATTPNGMKIFTILWAARDVDASPNRAEYTKFDGSNFLTHPMVGGNIKAALICHWRSVVRRGGDPAT